jgi:Outer membrane protein Omp28/Secretion system C-terminal sorting domain
MKKIFLLSFLIALSVGFGSRISYSQSGNNAILEYCTGTWCQWCPCGDNIAHNIQTIRPNTLVLAYHGPLNPSYPDPFKNFNGNNIIPLMGFSGYPTGVVGRVSGIIDRGTWGGWVNLTSNDYQPGVSYNITKNYNTSTRQLDVSVTATALRNIDTACYINFVIYEGNLVYPQTGNSSCPGSSTWVHEWVVRNMVNGATGELLHATGWTQGTTATKSSTTTLDNAWVANNCTVAVFAYLGNGSSIVTSGSPVQQTWKQDIIPTGVSNNNKIPVSYTLSQNYPNPFNPTTNIKFSLPKDGNVSLKIYDMVGNEVATYLDGFVKAGEYNAEIDGSNLASGVYFYRLTTPEFTDTKKMTLVK